MSKRAVLLITAFTILVLAACVSAPEGMGGHPSPGPSREDLPDSLEPDSRLSPVKVKPGEWVSRTLSVNDADWFSFTPDSAGILVAETAGDTDTVLDLYRDRDLLRENDDVGSDINAKIEYFVEGGVSYLIKVLGVRLAGAEENDSGPYRFRASLEPMPKKAGPNDALERAEPVVLGETITDHFFTAGEANWYAVAVPGAGRLTVNTEGTMDTLLEVYDKWEELIGRDDDSGYQGNAKVVADIISASPVYIKASAYENATGRYRLKTRFTPPAKPDSFENDNTMANAKEISGGGSQARNFTDAGDVDWALLRITRRGSYDIAATAVDNYLDTFIQLFDEAGNLLGEDDDGGGYWNAFLTRDLSPGTYYIRISCIDKEPLEHSEYTLSVSAGN
ncbi:MAG: DVUA0089 family protein [Treponema sp.]|nr:DVUA0089 family protein [Treponema sp.]